jgi:hypothetical protein
MESFSSLEPTNDQEKSDSVQIKEAEAPPEEIAISQSGVEAPNPKDLEKEVPSEKGEISKRIELLGLLLEDTHLFHTPEGEAYVTVGGQTLPIGGKGFRTWIQHQYYKKHGAIVSEKNLKETLQQSTAKALFDGPTLEVHLRYAYHDGKIFINLANDACEQIRVTKDGFRKILAKDSPIKFKRPAGMLPMPYPSNSPATLEELRRFFNVRNTQNLVLLVSWILGAMGPAGPYSVMIFQGEQGTGKSEAARLLKDLIDPFTAPLRTMPATEKDLLIAASRMHVLSFDNLSGVPPWLSDAFCRLATGGGLATRALYTNDSEVVFNARRPLILNGISDIATRHDLADRALTIHLPFIPEEDRMPEQQLAAEWAQAKPAIFRALLDAMCVALARKNQVHIPKLPRMADFAKWVTAAEPALGWPEGAFVQAFEANRMSLVDSALESDLVGSAILALMSKMAKWSGTPSQLYETLSGLLPDFERRSTGWPKGVNILSHRVIRAQAFLRKKNIQVERGKSGERVITIRKFVSRPGPSPLHAPSESCTPQPPSNGEIQYHPLPAMQSVVSEVWNKTMKKASTEHDDQLDADTREEGEI